MTDNAIPFFGEPPTAVATSLPNQANIVSVYNQAALSEAVRINSSMSDQVRNACIIAHSAMKNIPIQTLWQISETIAGMNIQGSKILDIVAWNARVIQAFEPMRQILLSLPHFPPLAERYEAWGEMGWTYSSKILFTDQFPPDKLADADAVVMKLLKDKNIISILQSSCDDIPQVSQNDYNEATISFREGLYKSCALLLFSLIDGVLIKRQLDSDRSKEKNRRPYGSKAAQNLMARFHNSALPIKIYFRFCGIHKVIEKFFSNGNDFVCESELINRNFVCHGMMNRTVNQIDCIKLFFLYYNVCEMGAYFDSLIIEAFAETEQP